MPAEATDERQLAAEDPETEELRRLFSLYRLANLNVRYYGCRSEKYEGYAWWLDLASASASALALGVLLLLDSPAETAQIARRIAAGLAGLAAFLTAIAPITGWSAKVKRFSGLHLLYAQLFVQVESVITWIRREGLSEQSRGASKQVHEAYRQVHALDEQEPDEELINRETDKVNKAFPEDYVWNHL